MQIMPQQAVDTVIRGLISGESFAVGDIKAGKATQTNREGFVLMQHIGQDTINTGQFEVLEAWAE